MPTEIKFFTRAKTKSMIEKKTAFKVKTLGKRYNILTYLTLTSEELDEIGALVKQVSTTKLELYIFINKRYEFHSCLEC